MKKYSLNKIGLKLTFITIWIAIWYCMAEGIGNEILLPSPLMVLSSIKEIMSEKEFTSIILSTLLRASISFICSLTLSIIIGGISSISKLFKEFISPVISILKSIPTMAFVIIALIWIDKDKAPFLIGIMISFPIFYDAIINSVKNVDEDLVDMADVYKVGIIRKINSIYIPSVMFSIHGVLNSTLSLILKVVVAGEIYGQPKYGIGASLQLEKMYLNTTAIFAWIVIIAVICILFTLISNVLERIIYKWKRG